MESEISEKTRIVSFDVLRIIASVMVVMLHVSASNWYSMSPNRVEWVAMNFYDSMSRSAVPLFFMLSGVFILKRTISIEDLFKKKIIPLALIYIVWSFLYAIYKIYSLKITVVGIIDIVNITIDSYNHLWYIPTLIGIYILQPILHAIVNYKKGVYVKYFLVLFFIFGIIRPTILLFLKNETMVALLNKVPLELMSYSGYVILGHYLANVTEKKFKTIHMILGFLFVVIISTIICQIDALNKGKPAGILYDYFTISSFLEAFFLFNFFKEIKFVNSTMLRKITYSISSLTLGVYLLHPFVLTQLKNKLNFDSLSYNTFISIPVNTIIVVLICFLVTFIMIKIPIVKKFWKF